MKVTNILAETKEDPQARLKRLKAELADMPQHPGSQEGYDAVDDLRHQIAKLEAELKSVSESASGEAGAAYAMRSKNVMQLLQEIGALMELHQAQHTKNPQDWGFAGDLSYVESELRKISSFLKGESE